MMASHGDIIVHDNEGLSLVSATGSRFPVMGPIYSFAVHPRKPCVAVSLPGTDGYSVVVAGLGRGGEKEVLPFVSEVGGLTWGPSGDRLTFVDRDANGGVVTIAEIDTGATDRLPLFMAPHEVAEPCWSADGKWLALEAQPTETLRGMTVYLYDADTGDLTLVDPLDEPLPKSAAPRFAPGDIRLGYTYTPVAASQSELRLVDAPPTFRTTLAGPGISDFRWADTGHALLANRHVGICVTELIVIEADSGRTRTLVSGDHSLTPQFISGDRAFFVRRECKGADYLPMGPGELWSISLVPVARGGPHASAGKWVRVARRRRVLLGALELAD